MVVPPAIPAVLGLALILFGAVVPGREEGEAPATAPPQPAAGLATEPPEVAEPMAGLVVTDHGDRYRP